MNIEPSFLRDCCVLVPIGVTIFTCGYYLGRRKNRARLALRPYGLFRK